ncbi:DUF3857 domain-containing protein [Polaribacter sp.]|uniref:DUF3857 domain-containing protein n=1 Tax=Polaribacter sp. TaxID=1920175 RepID=UPI004047993F
MKNLLLTTIFTLFIYISFYSQVKKSKQPYWIENIEYIKKPEKNVNSIEHGLFALLYENQINEKTGESYYRFAKKITENVGVQSGSSIDILYDPSFESLTFHSIFIIRNGNYINKLENCEFQVIRRELNLENYIYDGSLSAITNLSDVRVGDILEYSYSIKGRNPIFNNNFSENFYLNDVEPIGKIHLSILTDKKLDFTYLNTNKKFKISTKSNSNYYHYTNTKINTLEFDENAPSWKLQYEMAFVTEFKSLEELVNWGLNVFDVNKILSKSLKEKINEIDKKNIKTGDKINDALNFVQDEIRYLGLESGIGAYKPFESNKVFEQLYGDCKDKSLLLVTMLNEMGIEAYPMLVNTYLKKTILDLPPSPSLFDHCVVKVIDKEEGVFFYDPTISNQGGNFDTVAFPDYEYGLVLKKGIKEFDEIYSLSNNNIEVIDSFEIKEIGKGATLKTTTIYHDIEADYMRSYFKENSINTIKNEYEKFYSGYYFNIKSKYSPKYEDDIINNKFTTFEEYVIDSIWKKDISNNQLYINFDPYSITNSLSMPNKRERNQPFALPYPLTKTHKINIKLPEKWNISKDSYRINSPILFYDYVIKYKEKENLIELTHYIKTHKDHVTNEEFDEFYENLKKINNNIVFQIYIPNSFNNFKSKDLIEYFGIIIFILVLVIAVFLALITYKFDPKVKIESYYEKNKSISGWLIIIGIGLCISPLVLKFQFFTKNILLLNGSWIHFFDSTSSSFNISLGLIIFLELVVYVFAYVFIILCIVLFFNKRTSFPKLYSFLLIFMLLFLILDTILTNYVKGSEIQSSEYFDIIKSLISTTIISSYLLFSENVKETFVKQLRPDNTSLQYSIQQNENF